MSAQKQPLWLRCETKEFEHRAALTPTTAKKLIDNGFEITVERDHQRIFDDEEYEKVGCKLAEHSSWPNAPRSTPIIGLKELPIEDTPLPHEHVQFAHCYKHQAGWDGVLDRFIQGGGTLYDLEFLQDDKGRRVAAFGYHAGFAGSAVGLLALAEQTQGRTLGELKPYPNESALIEEVKAKLAAAKSALGHEPRALVIGALGRCGRGAVDFLKAAGLADSNILKWDMAETAKGGPFPELLDGASAVRSRPLTHTVDIFVNCIYLSSKIPSFLTHDFVDSVGDKRHLGVVVDVSCDTTNPNNPIPIYDINTTFAKPTVDVKTKTGPRLTVVSIDHLPTLLPREASEAFSNDLLPSLLEFPRRKEARVWTEAAQLFEKHAQEAKSFRSSQKTA